MVKPQVSVNAQLEKKMIDYDDIEPLVGPMPCRPKKWCLKSGATPKGESKMLGRKTRIRRTPKFLAQAIGRMEWLVTRVGKSIDVCGGNKIKDVF